MARDCSFYTFRQGDYYCNKKCDYVSDDTYHRYCTGYHYDECPIYKQTESSGCYLTTMTCIILNLDDNNEVLNTMRNFRDNILHNDSEYSPLLHDYDNIGPLIAYRMICSENKEILAKTLYNKILIPISDAVKNKNYKKAIALYTCMTFSLIETFGLKNNYDEIKDDSIRYSKTEIQKTGHGRRRVKSIDEFC